MDEMPNCIFYFLESQTKEQVLMHLLGEKLSYRFYHFVFETKEPAPMEHSDEMLMYRSAT